MYLDTLEHLRSLGAPLAAVDRTVVRAYTGGLTDPDVLHFDHACTNRGQASGRQELTVGQLHAAPLCLSCRDRAPFALTWLGALELTARTLDSTRELAVEARAETDKVAAGGVPNDRLFTLALRVASVRETLADFTAAATRGPSTQMAPVPADVLAWASGLVGQASDVLAQCRMQLRADDRWVTRFTDRPVTGYRYLVVPQPVAIPSAPLRARVAAGVYSTLGERLPRPGVRGYLFAVPDGLFSRELSNAEYINAKLRFAGPALPNDPADLPDLALRLLRSTCDKGTIGEPSDAVIAARGILTGA